MKKNTHRGDGGCDSERVVLESPPLPFRITAFELIGPFGTKIAAGTLAIEGLGEIAFDVFRNDRDGLSVSPQSIRSKFTGAWERSVRFEPEFRAALLEAVEARVDAR